MEFDLERYGFRKGFSWENRMVLHTKVGKYTVSTVDLGLNHSFTEIPLYYETMIFNWEEKEGENPFEYYQERYTTEEEARVGHEEAIEYVKNKLEEGK
jgi:hypothetical protein